MACDAAQFLPQDDWPDSEVERIVHLNLMVLGPAEPQGSRRSQRRLMPRWGVELRVVTEEAHELRLRIFRRKGGDWMAELYWGTTKVRALHTHSGHRNPNHHGALPNGHIHFPTNRYRLVEGGNSYAYEHNCDEDIDGHDFLQVSCAVLDINLDEFQTRFDTAELE